VYIQVGNAIANRLLSLSEKKSHKNIGNLTILICYTGPININMIENIIENENIEIRKCEI
jgi:glutamate racemase